MKLSQPTINNPDDNKDRIKTIRQYIIQRVRTLIHEKIINQLAHSELHCSRCGKTSIPTNVAINTNNESAAFFCGNSECQSLNMVSFNLTSTQIDDTIRAALTVHPDETPSGTTEFAIATDAVEQMINVGVVEKIVTGIINNKTEKAITEIGQITLPELTIEAMSGASFETLGATLVELYAKTIKAVPGLIQDGKVERAQEILNYLTTVIAKITARIARSQDKRTMIAEFVESIKKTSEESDTIDIIMDLIKFASILEASLSSATENIDKASSQYVATRALEDQIAGLRDMISTFVKNFSTTR